MFAKISPDQLRDFYLPEQFTQTSSERSHVPLSPSAGSDPDAPNDYSVTIRAEGLPAGVEVALDPEDATPTFMIKDERGLDGLIALMGGAKPGEKTSDLTYKINKVTKLLWRIGFAAAYVPYTRKFHDSYLYYYLGNPKQDFFTANPVLAKGFDRSTGFGRAVQKVYLPEQYRNMSYGELVSRREELRESGSRFQQASSRLMIASNIVRMAGNGLALGECLLGDEECNAATAALVGSDLAISGSFIAVQHYHGKGAGFVASAQKFRQAGEQAEYLARQGKAYKSFRLGKSVSLLGYSAMIANGAIRLHIEMEKWEKSDPNASVAQMVDAFTEIGQGASYSVYQGWLVYQGAKTLAATADVKLATDVMSVSARVIPAALLRSMQFFGVAGGVMALGRSGMSVVEGAAGKKIDWEGEGLGMRPKMETDLSEHDSTHLMVSGGLGSASAGLMIAAAVLVMPVGLTFGTALAVGGMILLAGQTIYDMVDPLEIEKKRAEKKTKEKLPEAG